MKPPTVALMLAMLFNEHARSASEIEADTNVDTMYGDHGENFFRPTTYGYELKTSARNRFVVRPPGHPALLCSKLYCSDPKFKNETHIYLFQVRLSNGKLSAIDSELSWYLYVR